MGKALRSLFLLPGLLAAPAAQRSTVTMGLLGAPAHRACWPQACAVELPPGFLPAERRLAARRASGEELPVVPEVLSWWPGGEPRWCTLRWGRFPPGSADFSLCAVPPRPSHLDPAGKRLSLQRGDHGEISVQYSGRNLLHADDHELVLGDAGALRLAWGNVEVEVDAVAVTLQPQALSTLGPDAAGVQLRARLGAASSAVRCGDLEVVLEGTQERLQLELAFTAQRSLLLRRLWLDGRCAALPVRGEDEPDRSSGGSARWVGVRGAPGPPSLAGGDLVLHCGPGRQGLTLLWEDFRGRGPCAVEAWENGRIRLELVAEPVVLQPGQVLRHRFRIGAEVRDPAPLAFARSPRPLELTPEDRDWLQAWQTFLLGWLQGQAGVEDRGCYPTSWGAFANGEYDLGGSVLGLARVLEDDGWARLGAAVVQHTLDWDRAADPPEGWPAGLTWMHGSDHASHELDVGHNWLGGFAELFRWRAASQARQHAADLVRALAARTPPEAYLGPERRLAWPLRAAVDWGSLWDDAAAAGLARTLAQELASRQAQPGYLQGDVRTVGARPVAWVNCWVSLGITVDALARLEHWSGDPRARETARRLGEFVLEHGREEDSLAQVLLVDPDSGEVLERRGRCTAGNAALAALGLWHLAQWEADPSIRELAVRLWEQCRRDLRTPRLEDVVEFAKALQAFPCVHSRKGT